MELSRRKLGLSTLGLAAMLAGCGILQNTNGVITVNLATVQAQAQGFVQAITAEVPVVTAFSAVAGSALAKELPLLQTVVTDFSALPATSTFGTVAQDLKSVLAIAEVVLPIVSPALGTATVAALNVSIQIFSALLAGQATLSVPASVIAPDTGFKAVKVISAPVPIPLTS